MTGNLKQLRRRALGHPPVKKAYHALEQEFAFLDEVLKARASAGLTQAQSAIARLESGLARPSVATLQRYASALGCRIEIKLVNASRQGKRVAKH